MKLLLLLALLGAARAVPVLQTQGQLTNQGQLNAPVTQEQLAPTGTVTGRDSVPITTTDEIKPVETVPTTNVPAQGVLGQTQFVQPGVQLGMMPQLGMPLMGGQMQPGLQSPVVSGIVSGDNLSKPLMAQPGLMGQPLINPNLGLGVNQPIVAPFVHPPLTQGQFPWWLLPYIGMQKSQLGIYPLGQSQLGLQQGQQGPTNPIVLPIVILPLMGGGVGGIYGQNIPSNLGFNQQLPGQFGQLGTTGLVGHDQMSGLNIPYGLGGRSQYTHTTQTGTLYGPAGGKRIGYSRYPPGLYSGVPGVRYVPGTIPFSGYGRSISSPVTGGLAQTPLYKHQLGQYDNIYGQGQGIYGQGLGNQGLYGGYQFPFYGQYPYQGWPFFPSQFSQYPQQFQGQQFQAQPLPIQGQPLPIQGQPLYQGDIITPQGQNIPQQGAPIQYPEVPANIGTVGTVGNVSQ